MAATSRRWPGYDKHTRRTKSIVVRAELRHCWDLLRLIRKGLQAVERHGGPGNVLLFPGEHYLYAKIAIRTCERARKILADNPDVWSPDPVEEETRTAYLAEVEGASPQTEFASWHTEALGAIAQLEAVPEFRSAAIEESAFDQAEARPRASAG